MASGLGLADDSTQSNTKPESFYEGLIERFAHARSCAFLFPMQRSDKHVHIYLFGDPASMHMPWFVWVRKRSIEPAVEFNHKLSHLHPSNVSTNAGARTSAELSTKSASMITSDPKVEWNGDEHEGMRKKRIRKVRP